MLQKLAMFLVLFCATLSFAQIQPSFQAFDADYLTLSEAAKGYHHFSIRVDYAPWAFVAEGNVKAPQGDVDLLFNSMDNDQLYIVVAYSESPIGGSDGLEYQAGIYDVMIYYSDGVDEFSTKIKDLKVSLLPPIASDSWATGSLEDAQGKRGNAGDVFKNPSNANAIFQASAHPLSKAQAQAARKAAVERQKNAVKARRDSIAAAEQEARDAESARLAKAKKAEKARQDSLAATANNRRKAARQASTVSTTTTSSSDNLSPRQRKLQQMQAEQAAKQKAQTTTVTPAASSKTATSTDPCDKPGMTPLQKKRCRMNSN
ncbi:MAG: hypothetical protein VZR14_01720 [Hallerella sp.]|jgi:pyruvate/2-oxoglutarate dehydrogenase complex dihydrolipoamide acyltransferase (E2) component|nr:hypothetical protein [Hallerella sp.]